jgi:membrane-associated phospholipid phosphatase
MKNILSIFSQNKTYFSGLLFLLTGAAVFLLINGKTGSSLSLEAGHPFALNVFFINYTFMGDGIFALCLTAAFFYYKRKQQGKALLYSFLISGLLLQLIKNFVDASGPQLYFESGQYLHFKDGISIANNAGLPSGHTATAFAIATVVAVMMKHKIRQLPILLAAVLVGYSRMYLAHHFLLDVVTGAFIGSASGILAVYFTQPIKGIKRSLKKIYRLPQSSATSPSILPV